MLDHHSLMYQQRLCVSNVQCREVCVTESWLLLYSFFTDLSGAILSSSRRCWC